MKGVKKQMIYIKKFWFDIIYRYSNDLIYRYKGNTPDAKYVKFHNALNITNKIQNIEISLADVKNNQKKF